MRTVLPQAIQAILVAAPFVTGFWMVNGQWQLGWGWRLAFIAVAALPCIVLDGRRRKAKERAREQRVAELKSQTRYRFSEAVSAQFNTPYLNTYLFAHDDAKASNLIQGTRGGSHFMAFDVEYREVTRDENGASIHQSRQTVVVFPHAQTDAVRFEVQPSPRFERVILGLLFGRSTQLRITADVALTENVAALRRFADNFYVTLGRGEDPSKSPALTMGLIEWCLAHPSLALEVLSDRVLVWSPDRLLLHEALDGVIDSTAKLVDIVAAASAEPRVLEWRPKSRPLGQAPRA